jgi:hypothetical protein
MRLNNTNIRGWKDLVGAFMKQYKFNMDITLDRSSLLMMEKGNKKKLFGSAPRDGEISALRSNPFYWKKK